MIVTCVVCGILFEAIDRNYKPRKTCSSMCRAALQRKTLGGVWTRTTHGLTGERLHNIWRDIFKRCKFNKYYAGKGITICPEWNDYLAFREWALQNGYSETLTIDRKDNSGNYEPSNCRWATMKDQCRNRSTSRVIEYDGAVRTLAEWAEVAGVSINTFHARIGRLGWTMYKALNYPHHEIIRG